ncbi:MAG: hypothetical protein NTV24_04100 [Candidatus Woesebacteria bacterium]|nr:hypothetical protein [Candidatus Woesebacteria bacterium]
MFPEVRVERRSITTALNICPDFKLTKMGSFVKNDFTKWADARLLNQPRMEKGLTLHNYQYWLYWTYEILADNNKHDPVLEYAKDLTEITGDLFKVPWLLSFPEKGFAVSEEIQTSSGLIFRNTQVEGNSYEREFIPNRFGKPVLIERAYDSSCNLTDIYLLYRDEEGRIILRYDDPEKWSYQYDQLCSVFLVGGPEHEVEDWARRDAPLPKSVLDGGFAKSIYTGEIVKGR